MAASIADLSVGQVAEITGIGCDRGTSRRLMEMGLLPGTRIRVVRVAPLGDPLELKIRNYSLSVRRSEAARIGVRVEGVR